MNVGELIQELQKLDPNLNVMVAGEEAEKVIVENCGGYKYVRIFKPWNANFVHRPLLPDEMSPSEESRTVPEPFFGDWR